MSRPAMGFGGATRQDAAHKGLKAVENTFSPEFRNRLDALVPFGSLTEDMMLRIVDKFMAEIVESLEQRHVSLELGQKARQWLARKGFDPVMGARPLRRLLRTELEDRLAHELLFGSLAKGGSARLDLVGDALVLESAGAKPARSAAASGKKPVKGKTKAAAPADTKKVKAGSKKKASGKGKTAGVAARDSAAGSGAARGKAVKKSGKAD